MARMKMSAQVAAPLLASAAVALLAGCRQPEMQRCVDEQNHVVADSFCKGQPGQQQGVRSGGGGLGYVPMYRYYYGGLGGYALGSMVSGGSLAPAAGHSYATGTSRGGFGSTHGSGGESGGGHGGGAGE